MNNRVKKAAKHGLVLSEKQDRPDLGKPEVFFWLGLIRRTNFFGSAWLDQAKNFVSLARPDKKKSLAWLDFFRTKI